MVKSLNQDELEAEYKSRVSLMEAALQVDPHTLKYLGDMQRAQIKQIVITQDADRPWRTMDYGMNIRDSTVTLYEHPFAMGAMRAAYYFFDQSNPPCLMIAKQFKQESSRTRENYIAQARTQALVAWMAQKFNVEENSAKPIRVIESPIMRIVHNGNEVLYNVEMKLNGGTFKKWINNAGHISKVDQVLLRFTQWTYEYSCGDIMVVDLQGVETDTEYILTDPAILSRVYGKYGQGDVGSAGMELILRGIEHASKRKTAQSLPLSQHPPR